MLKTIQQFPVDVVNVSSHDLRYFVDAVLRKDLERRDEAKTLLARLVATNTNDERHGAQVFNRYIVRELQSRQGGKPVRVAFIGLTEPSPPPPAGFKITDASEAARTILPEARKNADIVVALAKVTAAEAARIAREAPGIDIVIAGNAESLNESFTPPVRVGKTLIVYTPFETRMLGELRFYRDAQGKFSTKQRFIALDETLVPEDPAAKQVVDSAANAERDTRDTSKKLLEDWLQTSRLRVAPPDPNSTGNDAAPAYTSSSACSQCHVAQYMKWSNTAHAHATDPLPPRAIEFDASCLDCHATGAKSATASRTAEPARLQSVQCEQCHGPGSNHVAKPGKGYGRIADMHSLCSKCHTGETSPAFDLQTAWARVKH